MDSSMEPRPSSAAEKCHGKKRKVLYKNWLEDPIFKDWLQTSSDGDRMFCSVCQQSLICRRSALLSHVESQKHIDNLKCLNRALPYVPVDINNNANDNFAIKMKSTEIEFCSFIAEHNVPVSTVDHLVPLIRRLFVDPDIVKNFVLPRNKCTKIIKNVLGAATTPEIADILIKSKFSVMIDESTTIANKKLLCILVKVMKPGREIVTQCFDMLELERKNCSASAIFTAFKTLFENHKIPLTNIISFASDNASVMIGCKDSFVTRLKEINPNVIVLNCVCHSSALIASKACAKLPGVLVQFLNSVSSYFSSSPKRTGELEDFQRYFGVEVQKILKAASTRWLSLHQCIVRLLKNWIPLIHYFHLQSVENKTSNATEIYNNFNNPEIHAYLLFLEFTLNSFNKFNAVFQSREVQIHNLAKHSRRILEQMAMSFLKPNASDEITVDSVIPDNILPLQYINVGGECQKFLDNCDSEIAEKVKINCLEFYKVATREIINRLPYCDKFMSDLKFLESEIAFSNDIRLNFNELDAICAKFDLMHLAARINSEWLFLPFFFKGEQKQHISSLTLENMWTEIFKAEYSPGVPVFDNLKTLVDMVLILPHSNAEAERTFSNVTDIVTKKRNRIGSDTVAAICKFHL